MHQHSSVVKNQLDFNNTPQETNEPLFNFNFFFVGNLNLMHQHSSVIKTKLDSTKTPHETNETLFKFNFCLFLLKKTKIKEEERKRTLKMGRIKRYIPYRLGWSAWNVSLCGFLNIVWIAVRVPLPQENPVRISEILVTGLENQISPFFNGKFWYGGGGGEGPEEQ